jgi:hypothetical protein
MKQSKGDEERGKEEKERGTKEDKEGERRRRVLCDNNKRTEV